MTQANMGRGSAVYFTFQLIYYGFANMAGVKSSWGVERGEKRKSTQYRHSFCLKCLGLSPITIDVS